MHLHELCFKMTMRREKQVDLAPLRAGQLHELSRFVCSLASDQSVNTCMLNSPWHLEPLPSVRLSPMCGGGWKRGGTWENIKAL